MSEPIENIHLFYLSRYLSIFTLYYLKAMVPKHNFHKHLVNCLRTKLLQRCFYFKLVCRNFWQSRSMMDQTCVHLPFTATFYQSLTLLVTLYVFICL